jgi:hypothetical protein
MAVMKPTRITTSATKFTVCEERGRALVPELPVQFDRDEVIVCMVIAFCLGNAVLNLIYYLMT